LNLKKGLVLAFVVLLLLGALAGCGGQEAAQEPEKAEEAKGEEEAKEPESKWPEKTIEFVVPWKAGGGSDTMARSITKAIKEGNISPVPVVVVNKPGGNGQIGEAYVINKKGDPYTWMTLSSGQISIPLAGLGDIKATDFTALAQMAGDTLFLVVPADSKFNTLEDVVKAAKANPEGLKIGGSGSGTEDHIVTYLFEKAAGIKFNYIAFSGGSEVMSNLMGGHVDLAWANPNECLSQVEGGLVEVLGVTTEERLDSTPDIPTFRELGYDVVFWQVRGVHGPPGMPKEAVEGSIEILRKVSESDTWKEKYLEAKMLTPRFIPGDDYTKVIKDNEDMFREALGSMGLLKE